MNPKYNIELEIEGQFAMFSRPDCGITPVSYPIPTPSAVKGIIESIFYCPLVEVIPTRVEIMRPIKYMNFTTNYGGPLRKQVLRKKDNNQQLSSQMLTNVRYRIYACVKNIKLSGTEAWLSERAMKYLTNNNAHFYVVEFNKKLLGRRGSFKHVPFLGTKECTPTYVGIIRNPSEKPCEEINMEIPSMPMRVFRESHGHPDPIYSEVPVKIVKGVAEYPFERFL